MSLIKKLQNPKTCNYIDLKNIIFSLNFPWFIRDAHPWLPDDHKDALKFFSHNFLERPDCGHQLYPESCSDHTSLVGIVLKEIFNENNIDVSCIYRMNVNLLTPILPVQRTKEHVDHTFPHNNILIYLTDAGGRTIIDNESYDPNEDDIIIFPGCMHCIETSHTKNRVVLVATFQDG
jgi:hypothetical protein|tara:strand:- start:76 stop:606 length:531 start_codon:yes stop_codon:yes gene_type:complete